MEKEKVEIGKPVTFGEVALIPVIKFSLNEWDWGNRFFCFGIKRPVYIVAVSPSWKKAFYTNGEEIPFDNFIKEMPGLAEALERIKEEPPGVVQLPDSGG